MPRASDARFTPHRGTRSRTSNNTCSTSDTARARRWVNAGIVFTVVGGVLAIGGIAMSTAKVNVPGESEMPCNPRGDKAGNGCQPDGRNRAAAALAVPGGLLLLGGVAMLVVGKRQQARLRASDPSHYVAPVTSVMVCFALGFAALTAGGG